MTISFDTNIRPELLEIEEIRRLFDKILEITDILLTEGEELKLLFENNQQFDLIKKLREKGIKAVVLKKGAAGIRLFADKKNYLFLLSI